MAFEFRRNRRIEHVYTLDRGIASVVTSGSGNSEIETGIIGREGPPVRESGFLPSRSISRDF